ncbi:ParB/RepB/Spo0J family partition protein [Alloscardovia venturai]|uniref:ParB/RepB/Spo0J family partition protein n=1 Tax=Alloscardovia venturai TaxID=1769421 RepID=A0ABW2Y756_9BIFI
MVSSAFTLPSTATRGQGLSAIFRTAETATQGKEVVLLPTANLHGFTNHPFKVMDDAPMAALMESIEQGGIHTPLIVRANNHSYEIISGHRRAHAAQLLGIETVPCLIVDVDDDTATVMMVDANLNRPRLLLSEQAKSMRQRYQALSHQGKNTGEGTTAEILGRQYKKSASTVRRLVRLAALEDTMLELIDDKRVSAGAVKDLLQLTCEQRLIIVGFLSANPGFKLSNNAAHLIRIHTNRGEELTSEFLSQAMSETKPDTIRVDVPIVWLPDGVETLAQVKDLIYQACNRIKDEQDAHDEQEGLI